MVRSARRLGVALLVAGCSTASTYEVGQPIETIEGRVVASQVVAITGDATEVGPVAGAAIGAILGPLGALGGAGIGYLAERWMGGGEGIEYLVAMADGRTVTIVQEREGSERPLPVGTPVLVEMGALSSRVVEHPDVEPSGAAGAAGWVNPDALTAAA